MQHTFKTLLAELTEGVSSSFKPINENCLNMAYIKAVQKGLCEIGKDKVFSKECLQFIVDEYGKLLSDFNKK